MRRKDKEISDESGIRAIIKKAFVCRLGMVNGNKPYLVPLCFGYDDNVLYFHTHYRRENPTTMQKDYELLPQLIGKGRFLGVHVGVTANQQQYFKSWWGEGEVKIFLDGDKEFPTLLIQWLHDMFCHLDL